MKNAYFCKVGRSFSLTNAVIKVVPEDMRGKYKIGQHWSAPYRLKMAQNIIDREGLQNALPVLAIMGVQVRDGKCEIASEPDM